MKKEMSSGRFRLHGSLLVTHVLLSDGASRRDSLGLDEEVTESWSPCCIDFSNATIKQFYANSGGGEDCTTIHSDSFAEVTIRIPFKDFLKLYAEIKTKVLPGQLFRGRDN